MWLLSFLMMIPVWVSAQNITVKGTVKDATGEGMPGVNVLQQGTTNGIITGMDGSFTLNVPSNAKLVFSFIGYVTQTVSVNGQRVLNVTLKEDSQALDEVVVVGYGTMKKSDISGSVVSVDREAMMKKAPTNIGQALQGAAAGVIVTQQDGAPDANSAIRIRGIGTINGSADPLYVVDGVQVGTNANFVNPADIEGCLRYRHLRFSRCQRCHHDYHQARCQGPQQCDGDCRLRYPDVGLEAEDTGYRHIRKHHSRGQEQRRSGLI